MATVPGIPIATQQIEVGQQRPPLHKPLKQLDRQSPLPTAYGLFASVCFMPLPTSITVRNKCVDCGQIIAVEYDAGPHSGVMAWCHYPCPHCGKSQEHSLPGPVVGIKKATTCR